MLCPNPASTTAPTLSTRLMTANVPHSLPALSRFTRVKSEMPKTRRSAGSRGSKYSARSLASLASPKSVREAASGLRSMETDRNSERSTTLPYCGAWPRDASRRLASASHNCITFSSVSANSAACRCRSASSSASRCCAASAARAASALRAASSISLNTRSSREGAARRAKNCPVWHLLMCVSHTRTILSPQRRLASPRPLRAATPASNPRFTSLTTATVPVSGVAASLTARSSPSGFKAFPRCNRTVR
mmetsp:Transcript_6581/g.19502  ORF Transcript_6581/g.19502 Transcript_6581/m.19502 type:complete len:249 (-) Transcript_6581:452-1198(-)